MLLYRVFFYDPAAKPGKPGHPLYLHKPQGSGRWDNPDLYDAWYLAATPEGAIGETFGNLASWSTGMFQTGLGFKRALAIFAAPDDMCRFDFDNAANLLRIGMRPSEVVLRNKSHTQRRAAELFAESESNGARSWDALEWWSYHYAGWKNLMLWGTNEKPAPLKLHEIVDLKLATPAVAEAAAVLRRTLR